MKLSKQENFIKQGYLWKTDQSVFLKQPTGITNLTVEKFFPLSQHEIQNVSYDSKHIYIFSARQIRVLDHLLETIEILETNIKNMYSVQMLDSTNSCVIYAENGDIVNQHIMLGGITIKTLCNTFGRVLSIDYRVSFDKNVLSEPTYFRISDLLDEYTYWDYHIQDRLKVVTPFTIWSNQLFFQVHDFEVRESEMRFISLDLKTGEELMNVELKTLYHQFDSETGILYGLRGENWSYKEKELEVIDLNTGTIETKEVISKESFYGINPKNTTLAGNSLYFVDSRKDYGEITISYPRFGCIDLKTNSVIYAYEPTETMGADFAKPIVNEGKIYLRSSADKFFIFEEDNSFE